MSQPSPIELQAPDLSRWAPGNTGTPYVWSFDSGRAGPTCDGAGADPWQRDLRRASRWMRCSASSRHGSRSVAG